MASQKGEEELGRNALKLESMACDVLLQVFLVSWRSENMQEWDDNSIHERKYLNDLLKKYSNKDQRKSITEECSDRWDISLLSFILLNAWPSKFASDEMDGIRRIRKFRNDLNHDNKKLKLNQTTYTTLVSYFKEGMSKLGKYEDEIDDMLQRAEKIVNLADVTETTAWGDLHKDLQFEIRNKCVKFQDKLIELGKLSDDLSNLDSSILYQLSKEKKPVIVKNQIPKLPSYYIKRSLKCRTKLNIPYLQLEKSSQSWVVEIAGTDERHLQNFRNGLCDSESYRLTFVTNEKQFNAICESVNAPVHLIKCLGGNSCEWVKSNGSLQTLQQYVDESQQCIREDEIPSSIPEKVVIVSDSPGTGKTNLLASIASNMLSKNGNETALVQFITMKDFVQQLETERNISTEFLIQLIAEQSSNFDFGRKLVSKFLNSTDHKCFIMFDGLDEVPSNQLEIAMNALKAAKSLDSVQIYVTTRNQLGMLKKLEIELQTFGYTIQPFDKKDQMEFLLSFWEQSDEGITRNNSTKELAECLLNEVYKLNSLADREIAGIALQCYLLADLNSKHAKDCSTVNDKTFHDFSNIKTVSIFQMFLEHMRIRFNKISTGDQFLNGVSFKISNKVNPHEKIKNAHMYFALRELFQHEADQFQSLCESKWLNGLSLNELYEYGILERNAGSKLQFVHRTFAEFFVAWFAIEKQLTGSPAEVNFIISKIFGAQLKRKYWFKSYQIPKYEFNFPVVCYFINQFTTHIPKQGCQSTSMSTLVNSSEFTQLAPIFYASVIQNYPQIPEALTRYYGNKSIQLQPNVLEERLSELVINAIFFNNRELMETFCEEVGVQDLKLPHVSSERFTFTPLHLAIQFSKSDLVDYLLPKYENCLEKIKNLLRFCIDDSPEDLIDEIRELKSKIFNLLLNKNQDLATDYLSSLLLETDLKWDCLEKLILLPGIDVNVHDENNNTMLHRLNDYYRNYRNCSSKYYRVVKALRERKFKYFNLCNEKHITPLQYALKCINWQEEHFDFAFTLEIFASQGADFNHVDESGNSVLFYAISADWEGVDLISSLLAYGANRNHSNKNGENVFHFCAKHDKYDELKYLGSYNEEMKAKLNNTDNEGNTPLHHSVSGRVTYEDKLECQLFLINEESVKAKNNNGHTPFMQALISGYGVTRKVIQRMEEYGLVMTKPMASEVLKIALLKFPKHWVRGHRWPSNPTATLDYLFEKGGQLDAVFMQNLWKYQHTQTCLNNIIGYTKITEKLLDEAIARGITLSENVCMKIHVTSNEFEKSRLFYDFVLKQPNSFEQVFNILLANNQRDAVLSLKILLLEVATKHDPTVEGETRE